ncbi:MAG: hypothetical protein ACJ74Y_06030 [Bryobacteraceae bacterium]
MKNTGKNWLLELDTHAKGACWKTTFGLEVCHGGFQSRGKELQPAPATLGRLGQVQVKLRQVEILARQNRTASGLAARSPSLL